MAGEVWVLGATGRTGRAVVARLVGTDATSVLVGRDADRLRSAADAAGAGARTVVADSPEAIAAEIGRRHPAVVVNTIGPFSRTAVPIARACLAGGHYLDLANDVVAATALLDLHDEAVAAGRTLLTGVGFGVLATEAVVAALCRGRPTPAAVRVDAVPSVDVEAGAIGAALAATIVDVVTTGGRRYDDGRLVRSRVGGDVAHLTLPDGRAVTTAAGASGELVAARAASGAPSVVAASTLTPTRPAVRAVLPVAGPVLSLPPLRALAERRLARVRFAAQPRPHEHSWGHAVVRWADGTHREGWLRTGDAMAFTVDAVVEVVGRLLRSEGRPGAYTPAVAFGPDLATAAGGELVLD